VKYIASLPLIIVGALTAWSILPIDPAQYHVHIGILTSTIGVLFLAVYDLRDRQ
jgi:hypothetical protein